jgi:hypothetical protein
VAPALAAAHDGVLRLLDEWDSTLADTLFADNFFLDRDFVHWRREIAQLDERHGRLTPDGPFVVENWLRGEWCMTGERGWCRFALTMSPTVPPRIQELEIESTLPPSAALQKAAEEVVALVAQPTRRALTALCAANTNLTPLWDQVRLANILCGNCTLGEVTSGDSATWAGFTLLGSKNNLKMQIKVNQQGQVLELSFRLG